MIALFDYVKLVFSKDEKAWKDLNDTDKSRNFFMLNRFMSIKYPVQVNALSLLRINPVAASNYWHKTMSTVHSSTPTWIYAKTKKKGEAEKKMELPSDEYIKWHCYKNEISKKEFIEEITFFPDNITEMKKLEKILKSQGII